MDYFKPSNLEMIDQEQANHKFYEKVGSAFILAGVSGFFLYMNFGCETSISCFANNDTGNTNVPSNSETS